MPFDPLADVPTLGDLVPPYTDYPYYDGTAGPAFEAGAADYSRVNAWWLAEASLLAYGGPGLAAPLLERPTLLRRDGVTVSPVDGPDDNGVLVLSNERFVIAAFRGTRVPGLNSATEFLRSLAPDFTDVRTDVRLRPVPFGPGNVHRGFLDAYRQVEDGLRDRLADLAGRPVWFTGHSLGAALATLAAARFGPSAGLYTFGSPRVGDGDFAAAFGGRPCFRVVYDDDVVARLPPPLVQLLPVPVTYTHVGNLVYIDGDGNVSTDVDPGSLTDVFAGALNLADLLGGARTGLQDLLAILTQSRLPASLAQLPVARSGLTDHAPIYYAMLLKQDMERNSPARDGTV
jgi:hypothetical protein